MDVMEHLAADLQCALEETKIRKSRHWKHRRSRSTSNLFGTAGPKTDSDESKDANDSDDATNLACFAKLTIQNKSGAKYLNQHKIPMQSVVESDSFNELFGGCSQQKGQTKRRKRYKRMAVDASELNDKRPGGAGNDISSSVTAIVPKLNDASYVGKKNRKKLTPNDSQRSLDVDIGKRKRGHRDRPLPEGSNTGGIESTDVLLESVNGTELNLDEMDEDMKSDEDSTSAFSASESSETESSEGQEGDDEHSDYIGDEWVDDSVDSVERRRDLIMRRLQEYPYREIRAGKRRTHPNKPVFSIRTSANEQLSKFLQDPEQSELRLHPMRKSERLQLSQLASLYSLQMHYHREDDASEKGFACPILTFRKTSKTSQMDTEEGAYLNIESESESGSKRIKK